MVWLRHLNGSWPPSMQRGYTFHSIVVCYMTGWESEGGRQGCHALAAAATNCRHHDTPSTTPHQPKGWPRPYLADPHVPSAVSRPSHMLHVLT